ncbi:MAG: GNAT family N-acetyltransferase [Acetatifactor sp.]|nr:GNAT family N-acetyltransferase [Acetatifactor sp.]
MIRKATFDDIELIEDTYNEHFKHEMEHGAFTVFKKSIYPTKRDAEKAIDNGTLYVYEENDGIAGSIIVDQVQPAEYAKITWEQTFANDEVMVIHLLMVRPSKAGQGIATSSMNVGNAIEHSGHLFLETMLKHPSRSTQDRHIQETSLQYQNKSSQ